MSEQKAKDEKVRGNTLDYSADPPRDISWRFYPKGRGKVSEGDMVRELFDCGMNGNLYVSLFKVPEEYPIGWNNFTDLYEPEDACKILADWCHYKLFDSEGREVT